MGKEEHSSLISLGEWARLNGITEATARQKANRGTIPAFKVGRNWVIDKDVKNSDHRFGNKSRRWNRDKNKE